MFRKLSVAFHLSFISRIKDNLVPLLNAVIQDFADGGLKIFQTRKFSKNVKKSMKIL